MSLSTLLEAAKYLDYLDSSSNNTNINNNSSNINETQNTILGQHNSLNSNNNNQYINNQYQQNHQLQFQSQTQQQTRKRSVRRPRANKRNNGVGPSGPGLSSGSGVAMSLPASNTLSMTRGVPIPQISGNQNASLSSSFTTGSPLSSFASTVLSCSKASGVISASSSAASSLSSSDSSSSCGEVMMGDNDFNHAFIVSPAAGAAATSSKTKKVNMNDYNHHNYHIAHQQVEHNNNNRGKSSSSSVARYIAATSSGPQLVTMTSPVAIEGAGLRAGHVLQASGSVDGSPTSFSFINSQLGNGSGSSKTHHYRHQLHQYPIEGTLLGSGDNTHNMATSCPPYIMTRVQPMILNSGAGCVGGPSAAHSIMAFQQATASSPTSSSSSYSRHRELHKTLEKNRRAHLRHCFELLKAELPASECVEKKTSHINIIKSAIRYVLALREEEANLDNELHRLTKIKSDLTDCLASSGPSAPLSAPVHYKHHKSGADLMLEAAAVRAAEASAAAAAIFKIEPNHQLKGDHDDETNNNEQQPQLQEATTKRLDGQPPFEDETKPQQEPLALNRNQPAAEQQLSFLLSQSKID